MEASCCEANTEAEPDAIRGIRNTRATMTFRGTGNECFGTRIAHFKSEIAFDYATVASDLAEIRGKGNYAGSEITDHETKW